ncbi:MAG: flagellar biosynthesis protein FliQ [Gammaproteobacteria bacterium]|nr:flagellar biosynthesis protein FliQ [Gammaproteobacteria bacterium]
MSAEALLTIIREGLWVTILLAGPPLVAALATGLLVGMFQAATQINELTLSFIPKLAALAGVMIIAGPWMLQVLTTFTVRLINTIPSFVG